MMSDPLEGEFIRLCDGFEHALLGPESLELPRAILDARFSELDPKIVGRVLALLTYRATVLRLFDRLENFNFKDIDALYMESCEANCVGYITEALNYLRLHQALARQLRRMDWPTEWWFGTKMSPTATRRVIGAVEHVAGFDGSLVSSALVLGKAHALGERSSKARELFSYATAVRANMRAFPHDYGAATYYDHETLEQRRAMTAERRAMLPRRNVYGDVPAGTRFLVLISCERHYLRAHLPYWLSMVDYLGEDGFAFHFLVVDDAGIGPELVRDADVLLASLRRFRAKTDGHENVSFSSISCPPWCPSVKSLSACARLLYAREIAESSGVRVIALDINFHFTDDPRPWFEGIPEQQIALNANSVRRTIDPWRKFLAGTVVLPTNNQAVSRFRLVEDYLLCGLGEAESWYLDQNALAFFYDEVTSCVDALSVLAHLRERTGVARPFRGFPIHDLLEKRQAYR